MYRTCPVCDEEVENTIETKIGPYDRTLLDQKFKRHMRRHGKLTMLYYAIKEKLRP